MEDQFGGRTDDDLFYDDLEPVDRAPVVSIELPPQSEPELEPKPASPPAEIAAPPPATQAPTAPRLPKPSKPGATPKSKASSIPPNRSLASSRFADKPAVVQEPAAPEPQSPAAPNNAAPSDGSQDKHAAEVEVSSPTDAPKPSSPREQQQGSHHGKPPRGPSQSTVAGGESRLKSGANPRQKLTEEELAAKMEKMKLLAAEKTRKFEKAEQDERQHAEAYARGMEDARRRRAEEAERRRRADDERRKLDDERARNRERKLKAMSMKEGGWDEGKEAAEQQEARRGFRGANGGIRGSRGGEGGGLGASRFARGESDRPDVDRFLDERHTNRGRGRGGRGAGRGGGRGGSHPAGQAKEHAKASGAAPALTTDEFPALPGGATSKKSVDVAAGQATVALALPSPPPGGVGKWDDEMEALDAVANAT
ncbi:hypothetical protein HIM_08878 [Hirsutella minnesotensis 3608]|uniref:Uncharacterized protein n=1 Tax=Hirsutella minnesotensis 3608 TaxID=1043627 RepID=A0A0F7ZGZ2_9HYPO|nr:hypothetical protein HIM_08878 [Hirsutella minnesotensis 3608]